MKFLAIILLSAAIFTTGCNAEEQQAKPRSFLIVDLDGDGIDTIPLEESNAKFDVNGDGTLEKTEWITNKDGFLMAFTHADEEKFKTVEERMVAIFTDGAEKLIERDVNKDGIYDKSDLIKNGLRIQKDIILTITKDENMNGRPSTKKTNPAACKVISVTIPSKEIPGTVHCKNDRVFDLHIVTFQADFSE